MTSGPETNFGDYFKSALDTGLGFFKAKLDAQQPKQAKPAATAAPAWQKFVVPVAVGLGLLIVAAMLLRRK